MISSKIAHHWLAISGLLSFWHRSSNCCNPVTVVTRRLGSLRMGRSGQLVKWRYFNINYKTTKTRTTISVV